MRLNVVGYRFINQDGYGRYGVHLIRALAKRGIDVNPVQGQMLYDMPDDMLRMAGFNASDLTIFLMPPVALKDYIPPRAWIYTMHEDSALPRGWAESINRFERCLVPCEHNADVFRSSGVTVPIDVVYGGTSPDEFPIVPDMRHERPYTFICLADRGVRKGWDLVHSAFYQAFKDEPNVRLMIKARPGMMPSWFTPDIATDPRIKIWIEDTVDMRQVFEHADCIAYPARCDGWGMWWREAAMMGLPALVTNYSGNAVGVREAAIPLEQFTMQESLLDSGSHGGEWALPDMDELAQKMRWCFDNQAAARAKGLAAARWLRQNQTWDHTAKRLIDVIEAHG